MPLSDTTLIEQRHIVGDYYVMRLEAPEIAAAVRPGQYILLRIPNLEPTLLRRPFSVYRSHEGAVEILYKAVSRGTRAMTELRSGARISLMGPLGNGYPLESGGALPILVGGGYGVAPMAFLASRLPVKGLALLGGRTSDDVLCGEDFEALGWQLEIATQDGSRGRRGMVTELLDEHIGGAQPMVFACGPDGLLRAICERARTHGFTAWVSVNKYMVCGVGACLVCVQKLRDADGRQRHACACTDGPVFEARQVVWED